MCILYLSYNQKYNSGIKFQLSRSYDVPKNHLAPDLYSIRRVLDSDSCEDGILILHDLAPDVCLLYTSPSPRD